MINQIIKRLTVLALFVIPLTASADPASEALIRRMTDKIRSLGDYRVEFEIEHNGERSSGLFHVSGVKYHLITDTSEEISDGTVKYEINKSYREVVIDNVDHTDRTLLSDPATLFDFSDSGIKTTSVGVQHFRGRQCEVISVDLGQGQGMNNTVLYIDRATDLPAAVSYSFGNIGQVLLVVKSITAERNPGENLFKFDRSRYEGYDIIDFR